MGHANPRAIHSLVSNDTAERKKHDAVAQLWVAIDKLLRGMRLYEGEGPLVERLCSDVLRRAGDLVEGQLTVRVTSAGLVYGGHPLTPAGDKVPSYIFQLFCDGVREVSLLEGLSSEEVMTLAHILATDTRKSDDDFVTLLWQANLPHIRYFATDTLQEEEGSVDLPDEVQSSLASGSQVRGSDEGAELALGSDDLRVLKADDHLGWVREARAPMEAPAELSATCAKVAAQFQTPADHRRFIAVALRFGDDDPSVPSPLVMGAFDAALANGNVGDALGLIQGLSELAPRAGTPGKVLRKAMLSEERLVALAPLVDAHHERMLGPLAKLADSSTRRLVLLLTKLAPGPAQRALQELLEGQAVDLSAFYTRRLQHEDPDHVVAAIEALSRTGSDAAYGEISKALGHTLTPVRQAALEAMVGHFVPSARVALGRALRDPVRECRLLAVQVLADSKEGRSAGVILGAIQEGNFSDADEEEQAAFFEALASFRDPRTVDFFKKVLKDANITRDARVEKRQLQAIHALASMDDDRAREELRKAQGRWLLPQSVKDAARSAASRGRR